MPGPQKRAFRLFTCLLRSIRLYEAGDSLFKFTDLTSLLEGEPIKVGEGFSHAEEFNQEGVEGATGFFTIYRFGNRLPFHNLIVARASALSIS